MRRPCSTTSSVTRNLPNSCPTDTARPNDPQAAARHVVQREDLSPLRQRVLCLRVLLLLAHLGSLDPHIRPRAVRLPDAGLRHSLGPVPAAAVCVLSAAPHTTAETRGGISLSALVPATRADPLCTQHDAHRVGTGRLGVQFRHESHLRWHLHDGVAGPRCSVVGLVDGTCLQLCATRPRRSHGGALA